MTAITLFLLGRETSIPLSTICIGHRPVNARTKTYDDNYIAEVLMLNQWLEPKPACNDIKQVCPFADPKYTLPLNTPCPTCGALGSNMDGFTKCVD